MGDSLDKRAGRFPDTPARESRRLASTDIGLHLRDRAVAEFLAAELQLGRASPQLHEGIHQARKLLRRTRSILALGMGA